MTPTPDPQNPQPPVTSPPELTAEDLAPLSAAVTPLKPDLDLIYIYALINDAAAVDRDAESLFDQDLSRRKNRSHAEAIISFIIMIRQDLAGQRSREAEIRDSTPRSDRVLCSPSGEDGQTDWTRYAKLLTLVFWGGFTMFCLLAETSNAVYLLGESGLFPAGDFWGAFCFSLPVVVGPFVLLEYMLHTMGAEGLAYFKRFVRRIGLPAALLTILLYAYKIGGMQELDAFTGTSWPPLWLLLAAEMLILALMLTVSATFFVEARNAFFIYRPRPNALALSASAAVTTFDVATKGHLFALAAAKSTIAQLDGEKKTFTGDLSGRISPSTQGDRRQAGTDLIVNHVPFLHAGEML